MRTLFLRNVLNALFMLMAAVAMIGMVVSWGKEMPQWCMVLALLAVLVKMVEAMLRMPGLLKHPQGLRDQEERKREYDLTDFASSQARTSTEEHTDAPVSGTPEKEK